jgi:hypothetical protein
LYDTFCVQNGLKYFIDIVLEYAVTAVQENQVELELNGTHHLLVYYYFIVIVNVCVLRDNINIIKTQAVIDDGKEVGVEVNIKIATRSFGNVAKEQIKLRECFLPFSLQSIVFFCVLSKNVRIEMY